MLVAMLLPAAAQAVVVDSLQVTQDGDRYRVAMKVQLDASADAAYAVFADYQNLPRINAAVKQAQILPETTSPEVSRLYTQLRMCFSFFCKTLDQVQDMRRMPETPGGRLSAKVISERSDLLYGQADWRLSDGKTATQSLLEFNAELEPKFWIPPLIGPWIMQRKLRQEAIQTSEGIERLAHESVAHAAP
ncbi:SRPBCC family protein [Hydrocarboniphaga sp.]|uniref:SRPBCC family protein n=1 Tax=Hydrocarboniphaga sp. TaxID=2033016 RepID=UPI002603F9C6|nr:SRPBCC family protein [Hydrocarboniphaga sp.]